MRYLHSALMAVMLLSASPIQAQTGGITVLVVDSDGRALPGATVAISHEFGYVKTTAQLTDARGTVEFPVLHPGPGYIVEVTFPGLASIRETGLRVMLNDILTIPFQLTSRIEERVKVTAEREVIHLDTSEVATKFSDAFVADLPVPGRFYQNVLTMAPGVQDADGDGNPNVHGSRNRDFSAMVSGVRNVDPLTGQWMSRVNPNSIEELEIITAGAGVEFGRAQGGFARIVQKQGSNKLEGVAEFYLRTSKLDGSGAASRTSLSAPDFEWIQPAAQLTGPIVRDRLWFRLSHEYRKIDTPIALPDTLELTTQEEWTHSDQLTWQVSPRNKLALQLDSDPQHIENAAISAFRRSDAALASERNGETYRLKWTAAFSPRVLVESTVAWQDLNRSLVPNTQDVLNACMSSAELPAYTMKAQCADLDTGQITGSYYRSQDDHSQRFTLNSSATIHGGSFGGMRHQFKLGLTVENERYFRELEQQPFGSFTTSPLPGDPPALGPVPRFFARVSVPQEDDIRAMGTNWGVFVEDQFKARPNLTLTVGVRLDQEELNSEGHLTFGDYTVEDQLANFEHQLNVGISNDQAHVSSFIGYEQRELFEDQLTEILCEDNPLVGNCALIIGGDIERLFKKTSELNNVRRSDDIRIVNTHFSPSLSLAWSPWSNGKTALKFAAGRHYNLIPLNIPLIELEPALATISFKRGSDSWSNQGNLVVPDLQTVSRDLETPYQDELTFAIERALWPETSVSLRYIRREFEDQIQDININQGVGDFGKCKVQVFLAAWYDSHPWIVRSPIEPSNGFPSTVSSSFIVDPCPGGVCPPGVANDWLTDAYTGLRYPDTRLGHGDGWDSNLRTSRPTTPGYKGFDDCTGGQAGGGIVVLEDSIRRPDGLLDSYLQNPFFGEIMSVGNHNASDYEAWVVELVRRQFRSWEMNGSYTYSRATGDGEDFFQTLGNDPALRRDLRGYQSYDQRHVVKLNATTITPWGLRLGTAVTWQSGLPYSMLTEQFSIDASPMVLDENGLGGLRGRVRQSYPTGVRNDQRNPSYWNVDVKVTKELHLANRVDLQLSAEIFNALNDGTYSVFSSSTGQGQQINGINEGEYRFGRRWQMGMKLAF